ncbi:hypothetical protein H7100_00160 [Candidatus Saccharibacteria bacterium]|nr:hypothetical protein [Candidatus Saccharibacteria bacterium]
MILHYDSLNQPLTKDEIRNYRLKYPTGNFYLVILVFSMAFFIMFASIVLLIAVGTFLLGTQSFQSVVSGAIALTIAMIIYLPAYLLYRAFKKYQYRGAKLYRFAGLNGLIYTREIINPSFKGTLLSDTTTGTINDQVKNQSGTLFEFGNYEFTIGSGKGARSYSRGYISVSLDRELPNMVLDSRDNNIKIFGANISNLTTALRRDQVLRLEGDFNTHFTLYAPKEYERDALYIFTPDLMALFIDEASSFDAEIFGNTLYMYAGKSLKLEDTVVIERIARIIETVGTKLENQTSGYRDSRVGNKQSDVISAKGRRLRTRLSLWIFVGIGTWLIGWICLFIYWGIF